MLNKTTHSSVFVFNIRIFILFYLHFICVFDIELNIITSSELDVGIKAQPLTMIQYLSEVCGLKSRHSTINRPVSLLDISGRVWPEKRASVRRISPRVMRGYPYSASFATLHQLGSSSDPDSSNHVSKVL